jgi:hypothetical protein
VHVPGIILDELANFVTTAYGHEDIGEHEVWAEFRYFPNRSIAIANRYDVDALIFEGQSNHLLDVAVIVGHEYAGHRMLLFLCDVSSDHSRAWTGGLKRPHLPYHLDLFEHQGRSESTRFNCKCAGV